MSTVERRLSARMTSLLIAPKCLPISCGRVRTVVPRNDDEMLDPETDAAVRAALDRVEAGGELADGEAWLAGWRERLKAKWCARTG